MRHLNSPCDLFVTVAEYFQLNLDETCFVCSNGILRILGDSECKHHDNNVADNGVSITVLCVGSAGGVNGPVIFIAKGTSVHPWFSGDSLEKKYGLSVGSCVIPNKTAYMDDETWMKCVEVLAPAIHQMEVSMFFVFVYCSVILVGWFGGWWPRGGGDLAS